ncbi:PAQR family membrane homeostasis protein TrhA [Tessaracoccus oleiagri]|uniref:Hemolysin III n=1 Tax=Tessaracoccus oleiagri TaxID=686624 RepID=A0A1G9JSW3_9ACTN|nr:hemolysin III family protein [Tessaracoccus oleiagri]SDL40628.1 hemolysin III [Tessaracoccus oleiagri]
MARSDPAISAAAPAAAPAKPLLRGWLHLGMAPIILVVGVLLTALSPTIEGRIGAAVYTLSAVMLFGTSAAYHRGNWTPSTLAVFRRLDHSNIFIFIAGTYTPLALNLLDGSARWTLLAIAWTVATLGVGFRLAWLSAPRWLYTVLYVAMGWMAVGWMPQLWAAGGPTVVLLVIVGGLIYSLGAVAYATKRPQLSARWFGFHEVFHTATILAAICHLVAIWLSAFAA